MVTNLVGPEKLRRNSPVLVLHVFRVVFSQVVTIDARRASEGESRNLPRLRVGLLSPAKNACQSPGVQHQNSRQL
jgi:hypothetical protein